MGAGGKAKDVKILPIGHDHLNLRYENVIMSNLKEGETVVFSCKLTKFNRFGMRQDRFLLLTTDKLANVKKTEFQRSIKIPNILGVTKSTSKDNFEFVVHVRDEYDYRFMCNVRDELFECLKQVYYLATGKNLPVYGVEGKLKDFASSKKDV